MDNNQTKLFQPFEPSKKNNQNDTDARYIVSKEVSAVLNVSRPTLLVLPKQCNDTSISK